jgi:glycosyltransferase involved in cell wall biosynthesis
MTNAITLIVPFYRNSAMLKRQVQEWNKYPPGIKVVCVDDGSPEPAAPIIKAHCDPSCQLELYRITTDIPWNRGGARNLGAHVATTDWILHVDIDHVLPADAADRLLSFVVPPDRWYRFPRWRVGAADDTRKKDAIPTGADYGQIHPHVDSYLVRRDIYWQTGGYDEDYSGGLGGGNPFLQRLENTQPVGMLVPPIRLEVYTRNAVADANDLTLSRDTTKYRELKKQKQRSGNTTPKNPLRFSWVREL